MRLHGLMKRAVLSACLLSLGFVATQAESGSIRNSIREAVQARRDGTNVGSNTSGTTQISFSVNGLTRSFFVHTPTNFSASKNNGAVLVFHGGEGSGEKMAGTSRMSQWADAYGFLAVYPNAGARQWNDGRQTTRSSIDDVAFVRGIIDVLARDYGLDRRRVFATGISNGGMMVQKLACKSPGSFAGLAVIAANMPTALQSDCQPGGGTNIMFFNGTSDPLMPYGGGEIKKSRRKGAGGSVISVDDTLAFWSRANRCGGGKLVDATVDRQQDGTTVDRTVYRSCARAVVAYRINGGGHTWPGSGTRNTRIAGRTSHEVVASEVMLDFFRKKGL